ncbi:MAG TPA: hypothetical protein VFN67_00050 [Polyangiales bacterium]|nr:hypothetical protein [Polyangiales bacterium]
MLLRRGVWYGVVLALLCLPLSAAAEQPRDWMISAGKPGSYVNLDAVFGAFQASIEHRKNYFGSANQLTLRAGAIAALSFGATQLDADLRILILSFGASAGLVDVWRNQTFAAEEPLSRKQRREREAAGDMNTMGFGFVEARLGLAIPFNDYMVFNSTTFLRFTSSEARSFDNLINVVHDGNYLRSDIQMFVKHKRLGGIAPMAQVLNFPLDGARRTQLNYGFVFVSRAGFTRRNDALLFQLLIHPGGKLGGYDNREVYGLATLRSPISFVLAYRSVLSL